MGLFSPFYSVMYKSPLPANNQIFQAFYFSFYQIYWGILGIILASYGLLRILGICWIDLESLIFRVAISSLLVYFWPEIVNYISQLFNSISSSILPGLSWKGILEQIFGIAITYFLSKKQLYFFLAYYGLRWYLIIFLAMAIPCTFPLWILGKGTLTKALSSAYLALLFVQILNAAMTRLIQGAGWKEIPLALAASISLAILPWIISLAVPLFSVLRDLR